MVLRAKRPWCGGDTPKGENRGRDDSGRNGSGTIGIKESSSWDGSHKISNGTVGTTLLGRFAQNLIYWDNSSFLIFKKKEKRLSSSFHLF